jgi:hypothetical protein
MQPDSTFLFVGCLLLPRQSFQPVLLCFSQLDDQFLSQRRKLFLANLNALPHSMQYDNSELNREDKYAYKWEQKELE